MPNLEEFIEHEELFEFIKKFNESLNETPDDNIVSEIITHKM